MSWLRNDWKTRARALELELARMRRLQKAAGEYYDREAQEMAGEIVRLKEERLELLDNPRTRAVVTGEASIA